MTQWSINLSYLEKIKSLHLTLDHAYLVIYFKYKLIGGSRGGRARRAPPHLPGILVFDDISLADLGGARPPICLAS